MDAGLIECRPSESDLCGSTENKLCAEKPKDQITKLLLLNLQITFLILPMSIRERQSGYGYIAYFICLLQTLWVFYLWDNNLHFLQQLKPLYYVPEWYLLACEAQGNYVKRMDSNELVGQSTQELLGVFHGCDSHSLKYFRVLHYYLKT